MCLFIFSQYVSLHQWEMAGPEEYSLVETSEEQTLIKATMLPGEIPVHTLLLSWFMTENLTFHTWL